MTRLFAAAALAALVALPAAAQDRAQLKSKDTTAAQVDPPSLQIDAGPADADVEARWRAYVAEQTTGAVPQDINAVIQMALRESYLEQNKDLEYYADKVRHFNDMKKEVREQLKAARQAANAALVYSSEIKTACPRCLVAEKIDADAKAVKKAVKADDFNAVAAAIQELEDSLNTVGDDAQLANLDMQNALQKQQQTLQTISNVSKTLHDTAMAVIRKIG